MDFKKLIPDFKSVARTDWAKPNIDTKDKMWLAMAGAALLMLVFVFVPWQTVEMRNPFGGDESGSVSVLGITTWYGILGLIATVVVVYGVLYKSLQFVFCGSVLAALLGIIGCFVTAGFTKDGVEVTAEMIDLAKMVGAKVSHIGAILFLLASLATAGISFWQIKSEN